MALSATLSLRLFGPAALVIALLTSMSTAARSEALVTDEVIVTATREGALRAETPASVTVVNDEVIQKVRPAHPAEVLGRVPGVAIQQTNGEGHITGIRQPIDTSPVYLYLEDGIPVRPSGFFNHNAMYETNMPQSGGVEVIRGPGTALHGSDAIGGVINVLTRAPSRVPEASVMLEAGEYTWLRGLLSASGTRGDAGGRVDLNITHSDGWRDDTSYDRQIVNLRGDLETSEQSRLRTVLTATRIDQDTGANSYLSKDDYENDPTRNYTPFAYRKVDSARLSADWEHDAGQGLASVTPFVRYSEMELLPTFLLSSDPQISETGYVSVGTLLKYRQDIEPWRTRIITGVDLDFSPGFREEDRIWATRNGPVFESYTVQGPLYDYDVDFWQSSPYLQVETSPFDRLRIIAGLRYDVMGFRYDNHLADGPFTTQTTAGGPDATFFRPADDSVRYDRLSPSVGLTYRLTPSLNGFLSYKQSFRVPQENQLFRQGRNAAALDLEPVKADSIEAGLRGNVDDRVWWELSVYRMEKSDDILSFNDGVQSALTNNGETLHEGIEVAAGWAFHPEWRLDVSGTVANHTYDSWTVAGTQTFDGKDMASAPSTVANGVLNYAPRWLPGAEVEAEWVHLGEYWLDDANTARYDGHDLANLRINYDWSDQTTVFLRLTNLFDSRWATTARLRGTAEEYAPGLPFGIYGGVSQKF